MALAAASPDTLTEGRVQDLLSRGASPDACCNAFGGAALHETSQSDNDIVALGLIENGADINRKDSFGLSPLHYAAFKNAPKVAQLLVDVGADVNATDNNFETPLHHAAKWGSLEVARILLEAGADQSITNSKGKAAREIVCSISCPDEGAESTLEDLLQNAPVGS